MTRLATLASTVLAAALVAGCSDSSPAPKSDDTERIVLTPASGEGGDHTHAPGQDHGAGPVGDGTSATAGGYTLTAVELPGAERPGPMSFRIVDVAGEPLTGYVEEQTKLLHLYVVRADLGAFRHLHPTLAADGTWQTQVDLDTPGSWRVVAEFTPEGGTQQVILGATVVVPGTVTTTPVPTGDDAATGDDGVVKVRLLGPGKVDDNGRLRLAVTTLDDEALTLGSYLGASAHLTGFAVDSGRVVHLHPYGAPEVTDEGTVLTFHTTFTAPGDYRVFVQVRADGLLHQVAVTVPVGS